MIKKVIAFILMCLLVIVPVAGGIGTQEVRADVSVSPYNIIKVDEETGEELQGEEFSLYTLDGELIMVLPIREYDRGRTTLPFYWDTYSTGNMYFQYLPEEQFTLKPNEEITYIVKETKAPEGYILNEAEHRLKIINKYPFLFWDGVPFISDNSRYEGVSDYVEVTNKKADTITIIKKWEDGKIGNEANNREVPKVHIEEITGSSNTGEHQAEAEHNNKNLFTNIFNFFSGETVEAAEVEWNEYTDNDSSIKWMIDNDGYLHIEPISGDSGDLDIGWSSSISLSPWTNRSAIKGIVSKGTIKITGKTGALFQDCSNLVDISGLSNWDTSDCTDMSYMFDSCKSLVDVSAISNWDTSSVETMHRMFRNCKNLNNVSFSSWTGDNFKYMYDVFSNCSSLEFVDFGNIDTSKVKSFANIFSGCSKLKKVIWGGNFNPKGDNITEVSNQFILPTPRLTISTGKWKLLNSNISAMTPVELRDNYDGTTMAGTWVWDSYEIDTPDDKLVWETKQVSDDSKWEKIDDNTWKYVFYTNFDSNDYKVWEENIDGYESDATIDNYKIVNENNNMITITNMKKEPYSATGKISLIGKKTLTGRDLKDGEFEFELKESDNLIETVTNKDGKITFSDINYDLSDIGTHTYTVSEKGGNLPGIKYDNHTETITVEVADNEDGTLKADIKTDSDGIIFNNTYTASGTALLQGKKKLTGKAMDTFTFELKEGDKLISETTNDTSGDFSFKGIEYTLDDVGTHTYTISEKNDGKGGIDYDTHTETVTVEVSDNGDGTLKTDIKTDNDGVIFNNKYSTSGKAVISGKKMLDGKSMDNFTFVLKEGDEVVDEAVNDANGNFSFKELNYTSAGTHTYTITEKNDSKGGIEYDTHTETVVINTTDNGDGTLKVDVKTDNDGVAFNNNYSSSGKINFVGQKNLANKAMETFSFELKEGNDAIETVKNGTDGKIAFKTITYTLEDVGEHTYTVTEVNDKKPGTAYDTHTETIKVNVTDNGDGTLTATPVYDADGVVFNNTYSATGKTAISGKKILNNKAMEEFSFVLKEDDTEISTVKNSDTGEFAFPEIEYDLKDVGKHTYTITETNDNKPGVTYDEHVETVTIDVTDNGDGTLKVETTFDEDGVVFTNTYNADGTFIISGIKKLEGKDLADGDFTFILTDQDGNTKETTVKADGTFEFEPFSFTVDDIGKTFTYKVTEKNNGIENVTYDEHTEEITISVEDNGDGTLKITPVYDEDGVVFVNKYTEPVIETPVDTTTEPIVEETETPEETTYEEFHETPESTTVVDTGDQSIMPLIIAGILSAAGIIATSVVLKKRKHE